MKLRTLSKNTQILSLAVLLLFFTFIILLAYSVSSRSSIDDRIQADQANIQFTCLTSSGRKYGDINNDGIIDETDKKLMTQHITGIISLDEESLSAAQIDSVEKIGVRQVIIFQQYTDGTRQTFPACEDIPENERIYSYIIDSEIVGEEDKEEEEKIEIDDIIEEKEKINIIGRSKPNTDVNFIIKNQKEEEHIHVQSDQKGNWETSINKIHPNEEYELIGINKSDKFIEKHKSDPLIFTIEAEDENPTRQDLNIIAIIVVSILLGCCIAYLIAYTITISKIPPKKQKKTYTKPKTKKARTKKQQIREGVKRKKKKKM